MKVHTQTVTTDFLSAFSGLKSDLIQSLPVFLNSLIILVFGLFLAYVFKWLCSSGLKKTIKLLPNTITERPFIQKNLVSFAGGLGRIVFIFIVILSVATSLNNMGLTVASDWLESLARYLPNIVVALVIGFVGWKLKELISDFLFPYLNRTSFKYSRLATNVIAWTVFGISVLVALEQVGVDMSLVVTLSTVLLAVTASGIALTFALGAKSTISNILECYQLNRYLKVGQQIELSHCKGTVESIGPTFVLLDTPNGKVIVSGSRFNQEITTINNGAPS